MISPFLPEGLKILKLIFSFAKLMPKTLVLSLAIPAKSNASGVASLSCRLTIFTISLPLPLIPYFTGSIVPLYFKTPSPKTIISDCFAFGLKDL
ncbi:hypothetical protein [Nitrosopumilus spindle-shaped virus]|uniref:Uncharacterized protein n=1 Tax=Nitrosopumilus spindle-shaped virus TaxID=2508184 RepID=A0A514K373_9VIRU|nr:hypothetical protein [Nitrosopumilus spindle-shaped virus]